jgi:hypothetical protein
MDFQLPYDLDDELLPADYVNDLDLAQRAMIRWRQRQSIGAGHYDPLTLASLYLPYLPVLPQDCFVAYICSIVGIQRMSFRNDGCLSRLFIHRCVTTHTIGPIPELVTKLEITDCLALKRIESFNDYCESITIVNCPNLKELPPLPRQCTNLILKNTGVTVIPPRRDPDPEPVMPTMYVELSPGEQFLVPFEPQGKAFGYRDTYVKAWQAYHRELKSQLRQRERACLLKEDIAAAAWSFC